MNHGMDTACSSCVYILNCPDDKKQLAMESKTCPKHAPAYFDTLDMKYHADPLPRKELNNPWLF